jgi:hypothetical protein
LSGGEDGKLQLWSLAQPGAPIDAPPLPLLFACLPKPPGGGGGRGGRGGGAGRAARLWVAGRVLPGSLRPGGGCVAVAAGYNGNLLLYQFEPGAVGAAGLEGKGAATRPSCTHVEATSVARNSSGTLAAAG